MSKRSADSSTSLGPPSSKPWTAHVRRRLLAWFRANGRDLPWRRTSDPYAIWVSEIMLQQTQVATVEAYWRRFLDALPTIEALAAAREDDVLRLWEGLGYYRRARQLHRAAQVIVAEHEGQFPRDIDVVRRLPGIGRYTAGAILSIAFDDPHPILEANTIRLLSRLIAYQQPTHNAAGQQALWDVAARLAAGRRPGTVNQALMELGALVCTPRAPRCDACPVLAACAARRLNLVDAIPQLRPRPTIEDVREATVVARRGDRVLLRKRPAGERWAGLWDFARFPVAEGDHANVHFVKSEAERHTGLKLGELSPLATIRHGVTRFRITLDGYQARALPGGKLAHGWQWTPITELAEYPLSVTGRKIARLLDSRQKRNGARRAQHATP